MRQIWLINVLCTGILCVGFVGCTKQRNIQHETNAPVDSLQQFNYPEIPSFITDPDARKSYLATHYWEHVNFSDSVWSKHPENTDPFLVEYLQLLQQLPVKVAGKLLTSTLTLTESQPAVAVFFAKSFEKFLYDPLSPLRNDELFIPVLEYLLAADSTNETDSIRYRFLLERCSMNRIGTKVADFRATDVNHIKFSLHQLKAEYLVLLFYTPGCYSCEVVINQMKQSPVIRSLISNETLKIVAVCSEKDNQECSSFAVNLPRNWLVGTDVSEDIHQLFDLKASPTLFLLDSKKTVLLKDTEIHLIEAFFAK
jgi:thioredoxin-related protein